MQLLEMPLETEGVHPTCLSHTPALSHWPVISWSPRNRSGHDVEPGTAEEGHKALSRALVTTWTIHKMPTESSMPLVAGRGDPTRTPKSTRCSSPAPHSEEVRRERKAPSCGCCISG